MPDPLYGAWWGAALVLIYVLVLAVFAGIDHYIPEEDEPAEPWTDPGELAS